MTTSRRKFISIEKLRLALLALVALICSAVLFYFGTGLAPIAALTWIAPLPILLLAPRVSAKIAVGAAFLAYFLGTSNTWGFYLNSHDMPLPIGMLISVMTSVMFVLAVWIFRTLLRRGRALLAVAVTPSVWVGLLYLISLTSPMGIMGTLATTQADVLVVLQTASVTGAWGIEFLVLFVPSAIAMLLAPGVSTAARLRTGTITAVVIMMVLGGGALRMANESNMGLSQRVALVANNHTGWGTNVDTPAGRDLVASYVDEIAALPDGVRTVVLPEGEFSADDTSLANLVEPMTQIAHARHTDIVVGLMHRTQGTKFNVALIIPASGDDPLVFHKHHDWNSPPGHELVFLPNTGGRVGVMICADVNFPNPSRAYASAGTQLMVIPAADEDANGWQHSRTALLRGVENGQSVAWSARRGALMITDGRGRVLADIDTGGIATFTTAIADVPMGTGATPYTRFGDWFAWLCLALAFSGLIASYPRKALYIH